MASCRITDEYDIDYYTWRIPSVSSIPRIIGYVFQSPFFLFGGASWNLKMYPNGNSQENEGYTSLKIERLDARGNVDCYLHYKNIFNEQIDLESTVLTNFEKVVSISRLMQNLEKISQSSAIVIDDTLYLVIELWRDTSNESISPTISAKETVGTPNGNERILGEIFKEYEGGKCFYYSVSDIPDELPSNYLIESPEFSFLNAKWNFTLKQKKRGLLKDRVDIVLQRLESKVPVHHVILGIVLRHKKDVTKEESMSFDSVCIQSPALKFQLNYLPDFDEELEFLIKIRALKTLRYSLDPQKTSATKKLVHDLVEMFKCEEHSDVIIRVKNEEFHLHKCILACRSPYFRSMFGAEMKEKATGIVTIDDCEVDVFRNYVSFLYTGNVEEMTVENVCDLYEVADKYQEDQLKEECVFFMKAKMSVESFCDFIVLALKHGDKELLQSATDLFCRQTKEITENVNWHTFMTKYPSEANELHIKAFNTVGHQLFDDQRITKKRRINDRVI